MFCQKNLVADSKQKQLDDILELFDNIDVNDIKVSIFQKRSVIDAIQDVNKNIWALYPYKLSKGDKEIGKHGDIILGYYSDVPISFEVKQGDHYKEIIDLTSGEFIYAVNNSYPFLLISASWTEFRITERDVDLSNVYVIYGLVQKSIKLFLAQTNGMTFTLGSQYVCIYYKGHIGIYNIDDTRHQLIHILHMKKLKVYHPSIEEMIQKSNKCIMVFLKELMEYTWHPSRFMSWCMPHDEEMGSVVGAT